MARRGENIYKRKDGRYEGRYVIGRTAQGRTKFGYNNSTSLGIRYISFNVECVCIKIEILPLQTEAFTASYTSSSH